MTINKQQKYKGYNKNFDVCHISGTIVNLYNV